MARLIDKKRRKMAVLGVFITILVFVLTFFILKYKSKDSIRIISNNENTGLMGMQGELEYSKDTAHGLGEFYVQEEMDEETLKDILDENNIQNNTDDESEDNDTLSTSEYYIKVNYQANFVTVYKRATNGDLQPFKVMTCSTGEATPTSGIYTIQEKWVWGKLFGNVWGHYVSKIVGNILFHSVPYTEASPASLEYWEYDKLGTSASMGCVRLSVIDSKWIFDNMPSGTPVEFYASSNPGPLGKP